MKTCGAIESRVPEKTLKQIPQSIIVPPSTSESKHRKGASTPPDMTNARASARNPARNWVPERKPQHGLEQQDTRDPRADVPLWLPGSAVTVGRGDDTVGNPHWAQIHKFELFELILASKLDKQFPVEQRQQHLSQQHPPPLLHRPELAGHGRPPGRRALLGTGLMGTM